MQGGVNIVGDLPVISQDEDYKIVAVIVIPRYLCNLGK